MSRPSFGGDLFSPILSDSSFNDGHLNERNSGRGSISEILRKPSTLVSTQREDLKKESKRKNITNNLFPSEKVQIHRAGSSNSEVQIKAVERSDEVIETVKESTNVLPATKKKVSKSSRRSKNKEGQNHSDISETDRISRCVSNKSTSSKASNKKDNDLMQSKFITVRGSNSKREQVTVIPKIAMKEWVEEKENNNENSQKSCEKESLLDFSNEKKLLTEVMTKPNLEPTEKFDADVFPTAGSNLKPEAKEQVSSNLFTEASQIQGQILEKLINDTVSNKFMDIRLQLHQIHFSLLKGFGERMDEIEKSNEIMYKIIGDLLEENRQLRNMVSMH